MGWGSEVSVDKSAGELMVWDSQRVMKKQRNKKCFWY
jgi:hypothetical protein